jgi:hypothetical protein
MDTSHRPRSTHGDKLLKKWQTALTALLPDPQPIVIPFDHTTIQTHTVLIFVERGLVCER